ncbi:pectin acetylesterase 8-like [Andrographis paniculata]|uniref:pectin acetylesterase 8-like n=1 Tax=Andrographis paniculata TaxID=175694 RepID=UPI0021E7F65B|nr:pectin acetylesterase 8-like [Andrographis paniculata]
MGRIQQQQQWIVQIVIFLIFVLRVESQSVHISYLESAVAKGAVCLDGSPPAYHFDRGFGSGIKNWLIWFQGGAWCNTVADCLDRSKSYIGSSKFMNKTIEFAGILSNKATKNPDFHNWNRIQVNYCDGGSYTGDVEEVDPFTNLHFRGSRIFDAVVEEFLGLGMVDAHNVLISGSSAGGLTTMLHCDKFKELLPWTIHVKCLADAGYFLHVNTISGAPHFESFYAEVVALHGSAKNLPSSCTRRMKPSLCFFPENVVQDIRTPLFLINSAYDWYQINFIFIPNVSDPNEIWMKCKLNIVKCSREELEVLDGYRDKLIKALGNARPSTGIYINSCFVHTQIDVDSWFSEDSPRLAGKRIAEAAGDWYFNRGPLFRVIDCPFPCDKTCHNDVLGSHDQSIVDDALFQEHTYT